MTSVSAVLLDVGGVLLLPSPEAAAGIRPLHLDPYQDCPVPGDHEHIRHLADLPPLVR